MCASHPATIVELWAHNQALLFPTKQKRRSVLCSTVDLVHLCPEKMENDLKRESLNKIPSFLHGSASLTLRDFHSTDPLQFSFLPVQTSNHLIRYQVPQKPSAMRGNLVKPLRSFESYLWTRLFSISLEPADAQGRGLCLWFMNEYISFRQ